jgi:hypothetical protein
VHYIEGSNTLLNTNPEAKTNVLTKEQENAGWTVDDLIYREALERIFYHDDFLLFVHFHSIDDFNHAYSSEDIKTVNQVNKVMEFAKILAEYWDGNVFIVSDHGSYVYITPDGSFNYNHGGFHPSEMFVPYIRILR